MTDDYRVSFVNLLGIDGLEDLIYIEALRHLTATSRRRFRDTPGESWNGVEFRELFTRRDLEGLRIGLQGSTIKPSSLARSQCKENSPLQ
jgi:hypothetical protein